MKHSILLAGLAMTAGTSQAYVLDFGNGPSRPAICSSTAEGLGSTVTCTNWQPVLQSYGDVAGVVDVSYGQPRSATPASLLWWETAYNDLYGVLFANGGDGNSEARIVLAPLGGQAVTLTHFDLGAYPNSTLKTTLAVYEVGNPTALFSYSGNVGSGSTHTSFDLSVTSALGLEIVWQDSAYNVGIDNVTFAVGVVPEPATYALMLAGLGMVGLLAQRRGSRRSS